jgi:hypothetical protein
MAPPAWTTGFFAGLNEAPQGDEWHWFNHNGLDAAGGGRMGMFNDGGLPAALWRVEDNNWDRVSYMKSSQLRPDDLSDFSVHYPLAEAYGGIDYLGIIAGKPAFGSIGLLGDQISIATSGSPTDPLDWDGFITPEWTIASNRRILSHGGLPAFLAIESDQLVYRFPIP